jgi:hypothetical protein
MTLPPPSGQIPAPTSLSGIAIPGYEILEELGRGGMGVVYKARQLGLNRLVALKMILAGAYAGPEELARFRTEAEAVARLQHPNIVQIHEIGEYEGRPYFSLEYVDGGSLERMTAHKPQPFREAAQIVEILARAMHAAHQRGIVHRDLKPANVLLARSDSRHGVRLGSPAEAGYYEPKITDFGLAKKLDQAGGQTQSGVILGTPSYMAPEQAGGKNRQIGPAADVYALGAILYELLTGRPPFQGVTPLDTVLQVLSEEPIPPGRLRSKTPPELETICLNCLQKNPSQRYPSAEALADDLRRFLNDERIETRRPSEDEKVVKSSWHLLIALGLAVLGVALLLAGVMELKTLYLICAVAGGTLMVCQLVLTLVGVGGHHDFGGHDFHDAVGHDVPAGGHPESAGAVTSWFVGLLTLRTVVAALTFFGLAGLAGSQAGLGQPLVVFLALVAGGSAMFLIATLTRLLLKLEAEGTVHIERAAGANGTVYLPIPAGKAGVGKVMLNLQNRTVEYRAVTAQHELTTGTKVVVIAVISDDTVEVIPMADA